MARNDTRVQISSALRHSRAYLASMHSPQPKHQSRLSSYFSPNPSPNKATKRSSDVVDLTEDSTDDEQPSRKKQKGSSTTLDISPSSKSKSTNLSPNRAEKWRYNPSSTSATDAESETRASESRTRSKRAEAMKNKLLRERESSFFMRERSSPNLNDEQTKNRAHKEQADSRETIGPSSSKAVGGMNKASVQASQAGSDSEPDFWDKTATSSSKAAKGKKKASPVKSRAKRNEEPGPSGEPWTPLEKQVALCVRDLPFVHISYMSFIHRCSSSKKIILAHF